MPRNVWHMQIRGTGPNRSGAVVDADAFLGQLVEALKASGHVISSSGITYDAGEPDGPPVPVAVFNLTSPEAKPPESP